MTPPVDNLTGGSAVNEALLTLIQNLEEIMSTPERKYRIPPAARLRIHAAIAQALRTSI